MCPPLRIFPTAPAAPLPLSIRLVSPCDAGGQGGRVASPFSEVALRPRPHRHQPRVPLTTTWWTTASTARPLPGHWLSVPGLEDTGPSPGPGHGAHTCSIRGRTLHQATLLPKTEEGGSGYGAEGQPPTLQLTSAPAAHRDCAPGSAASEASCTFEVSEKGSLIVSGEQAPDQPTGLLPGSLDGPWLPACTLPSLRPFCHPAHREGIPVGRSRPQAL